MPQRQWTVHPGQTEGQTVILIEELCGHGNELEAMAVGVRLGTPGQNTSNVGYMVNSVSGKIRYIHLCLTTQ